MKTSRLRLCGLALISFAGCAHQQKTPDTDLVSLRHFLQNICPARAMHASLIVPSDASHDKAMTDYFDNYFESFLDAKEQKKHIACLEQDRQAKDFRKTHDDAEHWLKRSQDETAKYEAFFPPEKRIADVEETFADVGEKRASRHVVVTLRDGTRTVSDSEFDKAP
jgi:hypothetical protein